MSLWQMDIMGGVWLDNGTEAKLVTGIDDHSRYCVVAQLVLQATGRAVCQALVKGLEAWGLPEEILTDNGVRFTGRFAKPRRVEVLFEQILRDNGIGHRLTKVRSPTTTGKVERFHQTLRRELLEPEGSFASLAQAQQAVDAWVEVYNHQRPHQALAMAVPASRFRSRQDDPGEPGLVVTGDVDPPPPTGDPGPVELEVLVPASGNLQLVGRQLWAGRSLASQQVRIWADLRSIHLSATSDGRLLKTVPSRYSPDELALLHGHPTARPAGPAPAAAAALAGAAVVEVDRVVNGCGLLGIGGRQLGVGLLWAGRKVTVRVTPTLLQVVCDGRVVRRWRPRSRPSCGTGCRAPGSLVGRLSRPPDRSSSSASSASAARSRSPASGSRSACAMPANASWSWSTRTDSRSWIAVSSSPAPPEPRPRR
jgi:hypothetical protein